MRKIATAWLISLLLIMGYFPVPALAQGTPVKNVNSTSVDTATAAIQLCEIKGMIAYGTAYEAIVRGVNRAYWNAQPTSDYQVSFLEELYRRIEQSGYKDYLMFGSEKFHECMTPAITQDPATLEATAKCIARSDIVMYVRRYKAGGGGVAGTKRYARNYLKDPIRYPQKTINEIVDIAFPPISNEHLSELRQQVFHDCEFSS